MPVRVLVIDDDDLILELANDALSAKFEVTLAASPADALELADKTRFSIICCDYSMPVMDGAALLERLALKQPSMKALLLTGSDHSAAKSSRVAFAVLTKPFRPSELLEIVEALAEDDLPRATELADRWGVRTTAGKPPPFAST